MMAVRTAEKLLKVQYLSSLMGVWIWRHGGHVGVQNNAVICLLRIWLYYYAKLVGPFSIVLYTNMAVSSRGWKPRIYSSLGIVVHEEMLIRLGSGVGHSLAGRRPGRREVDLPDQRDFLDWLVVWLGEVRGINNCQPFPSSTVSRLARMRRPLGVWKYAKYA